MKLYRLYLDESGDHSYYSIEEEAKRYLGLTGCIIEAEYYRTTFHPNLESLKRKHFPHDPDYPVILHRKEVIHRKGAFWRLRDNAKLHAFNQDLLEFFERERYVVITVVIDKKTHIERYGAAAFHPYNYCLAAMLERYCGFLNFFNAHGDVLAESRGKREDKLLESAYTHIFETGTQWRGLDFFQNTLTTRNLKVKPKAANISGVQLADLLAYPSKQDILLENRRIDNIGDVFGRRVCRAIEQKYNRQIYQGRVEGYGKVFLK
jgi:hypothetical protein